MPDLGASMGTTQERAKMSESKHPPIGRRALFAGAGAAGALVAVAAVLPKVADEAVGAKTAALPAPAAQGSGYRLSEHVKQYYATART